MKLNLYAIHDKVAHIFNKPFTEVNNNTAIRVFEESISDSAHITDFNLYHVGTYDDQNGGIVQKEVINIRHGLDVAAKLLANVPASLKLQSQ